jgi:hypothetical protein
MVRQLNAARRYTSRPRVRFNSIGKGRGTVTTTAHHIETRLNRTTKYRVCPTDDCESSPSSIAGEDEIEDANSSNVDVEEPTVNQDPFAYVGETTAEDRPGGQGELCELHSYDSRYNAKGEQIVLRTGSKYAFDDKEENSPEAALVLTRYVDFGKVSETSLEIRSPYIKKALKGVIGSYPGVNIDSEQSVRIHGKPRCLFHYRHELDQYATASNDVSIKQHVIFCLKYMTKALQKEISIYDNIIGSKMSTPRANYEDLWMAFRPGALVYTKDQDSEYVYKFKDMDEDYDGCHHYWELELERVESNGKTFGLVDKSVRILRFDGYKALTDLAIFPLVFHKDYENVREELLIRGRKYAALTGVHYRIYDGVQKPAIGVQKPAIGVSSEMPGQGVRQVTKACYKLRPSH